MEAYTVRKSMMVLMLYSERKRDLSDFVASSAGNQNRSAVVNVERFTRPCRSIDFSFDNTPRREDQLMHVSRVHCPVVVT